jgi:serine/threonine-protein kinase
VAQTLDFVHGRGRLHRDVSPGNIIFDEQGNPHLSDFGIATVIRGDDDPDETAQDLANLTKPGGFVGAATYAPPESIERKLNPAYDQYSLAVVVYEALCGQVPFERGSSEAVLVAKNTQPPTPLDSRRAGLPAGCVAAVMRALSKDPAQRFESSVAFARAFEEGVRGSEATPAPQPPVQDSGTVVVDAIDLARHERRAPWAPIAAGILLLALAAGGGWYFLLGPGAKSGPALAGEALVADSPTSIEVQVGSTPEEQ